MKRMIKDLLSFFTAILFIALWIMSMFTFPYSAPFSLFIIILVITYYREGYYEDDKKVTADE